MVSLRQIRHVVRSDYTMNIGVTVLVYWLAGMLGMSLGESTGYVSPVFPAAGFAIAMMVYTENKGWPGVWLGSLALNLWIAQTHAGITTSTVVALGIASGSTLQAVSASWLLKRRGIACQQLETASDIGRSLFWAGPMACIISASAGIGTLYAMGLMPASAWLHSWWVWWTGDTLGVVLAMPITMAILCRKAPSWRSRLITVIVPTVITLGVVSAAYFATAHWEHKQQRNAIDKYGQTIVQLLEHRFIAHQEALSSLKRLIEVTPDMTFQQFEHFTAVTLKDNPDIFALSFNSYVQLKQRAEYEKDFALRNGKPGFEITERNAAKQLVRAADRPGYVSVSYIAPLAGNLPAVGYDIFSEPIRRQAIANAITTRQPVITAPIRLVQENRERVGMLVLHPAYHRLDADDHSDSIDPLGFAVGVIKADEMIGIATRKALIDGLVFEIDDSGTGKPIYLSSTAAHRPADRSEIQEGKVTVADRSWTVSVWATEEYVQNHHLWTSWIVGVIGVTMASLLQVLVLVITGHTAIVERKVQDQTHELRERGEALEDRNAQLSALFSLSPDGLVALSSDGIIKFVNPAFQAMTGIASSELVGNHVDDYLDKRLREHAENPGSFSGIAACFSNRDENPQTLVLRAPRYTVLQLVGIHSEAASASQLIYSRDITREAEVDRMKSDFLSHAAHELRTPMASIYGFSELLLVRELDPDTRRELLETIHRQTQGLVAIINELLDLVRIEARQGKDFTIQSVDLPPLIRETLDDLAFDAERWPIAFQFDKAIPMVRADRGKLRQALINVLNNAQKYSPEGGQIQIEIVSRTGMTGISIRDHGIGMTSDELKHFGERFWRADTSGNIPGTGLGTAIVKEILQILGGKVEVMSKPDAGTTVTLWLQESTPPTGRPFGKAPVESVV